MHFTGAMTLLPGQLATLLVRKNKHLVARLDKIEAEPLSPFADKLA